MKTPALLQSGELLAAEISLSAVPMLRNSGLRSVKDTSTRSFLVPKPGLGLARHSVPSRGSSPGWPEPGREPGLA